MSGQKYGSLEKLGKKWKSRKKPHIPARGCDGSQAEAAEWCREGFETDPYGWGSRSTVREEAGRETALENPNSLSGWIRSLTLRIQMFAIKQADVLIFHSVYFYSFIEIKLVCN